MSAEKKRERSVWTKEIVGKVAKLILDDKYKEAFETVDEEVTKLIENKVSLRKLQCSFDAGDTKKHDYRKQVNAHAAGMLKKYYNKRSDFERIAVVYVDRQTNKSEKGFPVDVLIDQCTEKKLKVDYVHYLTECCTLLSMICLDNEYNIFRHWNKVKCDHPLQGLNFITRYFDYKKAYASKILHSSSHLSSCITVC
jgi:hypothetical protein